MKMKLGQTVKTLTAIKNSHKDDLWDITSLHDSGIIEIRKQGTQQYIQLFSDMVQVQE